MKQLLLWMTLFLSFSCSSHSQERRDSFTSTSPADTMPAPLSVSPADTMPAVSLLSDTLRLLFVGDLMQHQGQIDAARTARGYDYSACFAYVKEVISQADFAVANLEVTLGGKPYRGYPAFSAPDEYLTAIHDAGFNVLLTANNHCLDRGRKGLERTLRLIDSLHIPAAGTYTDIEDRRTRYPLLLEKKGFRIALLNYTYGTNGIPVPSPAVVNLIDTTVIAQDIEKARQLHPDVLLACMHWGVEYQSLPGKEQQKLAQWLFAKGVDHIIGAHPHVVQPIEVHTDSLTRQKRLVAYSLGNFISNMSARRTDGGLMLQMEFVKNEAEKERTSLKGEEERTNLKGEKERKEEEKKSREEEKRGAQLKKCEYYLVWTDRPIHSKKKNHQILPINFPADSLTINSRNLLNLFTKDTRKLLDKENKGIEEQFFYEKNSKKFGD
ncbi:CapA family protein [uncultured Bacteroides sp.]|jgi:poly-gamma-glutamate capsule biosynthesis protein CapA/YwtB (metallophosphatase superfamily)|uniref:CapA family protein n=1 Tax=uncultured Bacteroides sp. TaxID=162156 RepID=UPI0025CD89FB|nr:CapA family protein [uncultured Bacteroides sp.]